MRKTLSIATKVSFETRARLERMRVKFGFKSVYEIIQFAIASLLRVADPEGDAPDDRDARVVQLSEMFADLDDYTRGEGQKRKLSAVVMVFERTHGKDARRLRVMPDGGYRVKPGWDAALSGIFADVSPVLSRNFRELCELTCERPAVALMHAVNSALDTAREIADDEEIAGDFREMSDAESPAYGERTRRTVGHSVNEDA